MRLPRPSPIMATRLEKAAEDTGFDLRLPALEGWLGFASTHAPLKIWLSTFGKEEELLLAAMSMAHVARDLGGRGIPMAAPLPEGANGGCTVNDIPALHRLLRRAFQLSNTLPDALLDQFNQKTASLPRTTEAERLVIQRVGQDLFRQGLMDYWEGRCAVTGLAVPELLRASHIKAWAHCETDAERLDTYNGLLLAPHLDAAFDQFFITVADDTTILISPTLTPEARHHLNLDHPLKVRHLHDRHQPYLEWHRQRLRDNIS